MYADATKERRKKKTEGNRPSFVPRKRAKHLLGHTRASFTCITPEARQQRRAHKDTDTDTDTDTEIETNTHKVCHVIQVVIHSRGGEG